jgi:hypothetical protein
LISNFHSKEDNKTTTATMLSFIVVPHNCVKTGMHMDATTASTIEFAEENTSSNSSDHSIDSSDSMTTLTAEYLVDGIASPMDDSTPAQQCGEMQLVVNATAGGGHCSDDSSMSTWSWWGEDPLGLEENSLEDDDYVEDIFGMDSSFHATRLTPLKGGAAAECYMVDVAPSSLCNPAVY